MRQETRNCQNCKQNFVIEDEDFVFYKKISVPPPTWCPECRLIRRLTWRQDRTLYKDSCDLCGKETFSVYHPDSPFTVYCSPCWWSDKWDPLEYGREFDFSKPFFQQFEELVRVVPRQATGTFKSVNCHYGDAIINSKNCYLNFGTYYSEDCLYCNAPIMSKSCVDSDLGKNMDHVYETHNSDNVYSTKFTWFSEDCVNSSFLFDCKGCSDCFGCINLRNKKYHIFNEPFSKEAYQEKMKEWDLGTYQKVQEALEKFRGFYYSMPRRYAWIVHSENVSGENIRGTKNCHFCFTTLDGVENCKYGFFVGLGMKDSYDIGASGEMSELFYEVTGTGRAQRIFFCKGGTESTDLEYCDWVEASQYLFGCAAVRNRKYCILNKQYSKEEYKALVPKIKKHMMDIPYTDARGNVYRYGEYFPSEISPWAYNESFAWQWFPWTKEETLAKGFRWRDRPEREYKVTIQPQDLPDHIKDVPDSILQETIGCSHEGKCNEQCATAFRIIPEELKFYRQMNIALPRLCYNCRYFQRIRWRNPAKLWHRACQCAGEKSDVRKDDNYAYQNQSAHFHGSGHCPNEFETAIAPERREIVYCQQCYNDEFI